MQKQRLDIYLTQQHRHYSRTQIKGLIEEGFVLVNGEKRKPGFILHGGEKIEMVRRAPEIPKAEPEDIPLQIVYEDEDLIVINKQAGMVVHPAPGNLRGTVVNAILHHLGNAPTRPPPLNLRGGGGELSTEWMRPGIVHRLDKGTSGVMVIAKTDEAHRHLSKQFKDRAVEKTYEALVFGKFPQKNGTISQAIGRDTVHRRKFSSKSRHVRDAVTLYQVVREYEGLTLLTLSPKTGRTHQLRVHLSEMHRPIVGDALYGARSYLSSIKEDRMGSLLSGVGRPLLHAAALKIRHPHTGEFMTFTAPLPDDFRSVLEFL